MVKNHASAHSVLPANTSAEDRQFFVEYVSKVVNGLNEGNLLLYKLSKNDLDSYRSTEADEFITPKF